MSRFFRSGDDSSTESSSDEEDLYSEEEEEEQEQSEEEGSGEGDDSESESSDSDDDKKKEAKGFSAGWSDSDQSDTEPTAKVRSAKDKRQDELEAIITLINNAEKINDWNTISTGKYPVMMIIISSQCARAYTNHAQSSTSSTARLRR